MSDQLWENIHKIDEERISELEAEVERLKKQIESHRGCLKRIQFDCRHLYTAEKAAKEELAKGFINGAYRIYQLFSPED